jgi:hypothetical protein
LICTWRSREYIWIYLLSWHFTLLWPTQPMMLGFSEKKWQLLSWSRNSHLSRIWRFIVIFTKVTTRPYSKPAEPNYYTDLK